MSKVVLASQSPRRKKLLELINMEFDIVVSTIPETSRADLDPLPFVEEMSLRKARQIASQKSDSLVIGADTAVIHNNEILGKPVDINDARQMLHRLSGTTHRVTTAVSLVKSNSEGKVTNTQTFQESTEVTFGSISDWEIDEYVKTGGPKDKAGSYGIQDDWGALFVKRIDGDYYNVVGFPLFSFYRNLKEFSPEHIPHAI